MGGSAWWKIKGENPKKEIDGILFLGKHSGDMIFTLVRFMLHPMPYRLMEPRFPLEEVYASAGAAERLAEYELRRILHRHH